MQRYSKFLMSLLVTVATLLVGVLTDGITTAEWLTVAASAVASAAVLLTANTLGSPAVKTALQALAPFLGGLAVAVLTPDGITASVVINLAIAAAGVFGVYGSRNVGDDYDLAVTGRHAA
jgi:hypothetical protein